MAREARWATGAGLFAWLVSLGCGGAGGMSSARPTPVLAARPAWVDSPGAAPYQRDRYLVGTGVVESTANLAQDRTAADQLAFAEIANQIRTLIHSDLSLQHVESVAGESASLSRSTTASVRLSSSLELNGLTIVDRFHDPQRRLLHSLAVLDLDAATAPVRALLADLKRSYQKSIESARELCLNGAVSSCLAQLRQAFDNARSYQATVPYYRLLRSRAGAEPAVGDEPSPSLVISTASNVVAGLTLQRESGDGQEGLVGRPLPNAIRVVVLAGGEKTVPARGLPVRFQFQEGRGELTEVSVSDTAGIAEAIVHNLERTSTGRYVIRAMLDLDAEIEQMPADWKAFVKPPAQSVTFGISRKRAPAALKVLVLMDQPETTELLSTELLQVGYSPMAEAAIDRALSARVRRLLSGNQYDQLVRAMKGNADLVALGSVDTNPIGAYEGVRAFEARGWAKVVRIADGRVLADDVTRDVRGFGATDEQARRNAVRAGAQQLAESMIAQLLSGK